MKEQKPTRNRLIITMISTPQSASTKKRFVQETFPKKKIVEDLIAEAKRNKERRESLAISIRKQNCKNISTIGVFFPHEEYIDPIIPVRAIKHNQDIYKNVEGFKCTSQYSANKILSKRNKRCIGSAIFYDNHGISISLI